ncbi:MAG: hypothetical protein COB53_04035 [Elusimicrobia bacterium]|nr:MAG: hypothetical protein COB53_04035 [Elusimicrobiota bacterium]
MAIQRYGGAAYGLAASLAVLAMPVAAIGAKKLATKFSAKGGLALALVGASATSAALFVLFGANALPWLGLVAGLTAVQGSFAVMRTLDKVIPGQLYGEDSLKIKRFNGLSFAVSRLPGILIPLAIGSILAAVGQYGALAIFSLAMLAAAPLVKLIKTNSPARNAEEPTTGTGDPELLRLSGWGFASQQIMTYVLPFILVSAYGRYAGGGDPAAAKAIGGMLFSFWTVGLLGGTIALIRSARRANPVTSMRRAAFIGAFGLFGFIPLLFSTPIPAYIGIAAAGFTNAYSFLSYLSTAQANASEDNRAGTIARYMMFSFLVVAAAVWGLGTLIQYYPADAVPFAALLSGLGGLSLLNLWIAAKLRGRES